MLARDNLDLESRELVTLAALATLHDVDPQLASHFRVALRLGIPKEQLRGVANVIDEKIDRARGENAHRVLVETLRTSSQETLEKPASHVP